MNDFLRKLQGLKQNGYQLDLGEIISQSFENYKKIAVTVGVAMILVSIVFIIIGFGSLGLLIGFSDFAQKMTEFQITNFSTVTLILYIFGTAVFSALTYPFTAGVIKMCHEAEIGHEISISMVFDHYKSDRFKDLFLSALLISFATSSFTTLCEFAGYKFIGLIFTYAIAFLAVFMIPLIIFGKLNYMDAIKNSFALVFKQPFVILIALIVALLMAMVGIIGLCIGIFFTMPFIYSTHYILYKNAVGVVDKSEIDEIGTTEI